jgi:hypothetical protein
MSSMYEININWTLEEFINIMREKVIMQIENLIKNKEHAIDDKIYQKFKNAGSFLPLDADIGSTLALLISNTSVRLDF